MSYPVSSYSVNRNASSPSGIFQSTSLGKPIANCFKQNLVVNDSEKERGGKERAGHTFFRCPSLWNEARTANLAWLLIVSNCTKMNLVYLNYN